MFKTGRYFGSWLFATLLAFAPAAWGQATTNCAASDQTTLQTCITAYQNDATNNHTITISYDFTINPITINKTAGSGTLTIKSSDGNQFILTRGATGNLFTLLGSAHLILENIIIDGDKSNTAFANNSGALVFMDAITAVTLEMKEGAILRNNKNNSDGGGVCCRQRCTFIMDGGEISGNDAGATGGGVFVSTNNSGTIYYSTFIMNGGKITGNTANSADGGGGVAVVWYGAFTMNGGEISNNTATNSNGNGGGVRIRHDATFTVGGNAVITGNEKGGADNNVYLDNGKYITLSTDTPPETGMKIGVTTATASGVFVNAGGAGYGSYFFPDNDDRAIAYLDGALTLVNNANCTAGNFTEFEACLGQYASVAAGEALTVKVTADIDITAAQTITTTTANTTLIITSEGTPAKVLTRGATGNLFTLSGSTKLILENIIIDGDNVDNVSVSAALITVNDANAELVMNSGAVLKRNKSNPANCSGVGGGGGGVYVQNGKFTMNDGEISGNLARCGGGVFVAEAGTFDMKSGEIYDNTTTNNGGGVLSNGTFTMSGGNITGNKTENQGAGVVADGSYFFEMTGGTISGNEITKSNTASLGAGVYVAANATFRVGGSAKVIENTNSSGAQNVYLYNGSYIALSTTPPTTGMSVGVTTATASGVIVNSGASAAIAEYFVPDDPTKEIAFEGGALKLVAGCPALVATFAEFQTCVDRYASGSGDYVITIKNVINTKALTINKTGNDGGKLTITSTSLYTAYLERDESQTSNNGLIAISGNAYVILDNIYTRGGFNSYEEYIVDDYDQFSVPYPNNAASIFRVNDGATLELRNGLIVNNKASNGGGVYVASGGTFIMNGGEISGCYAESNGGATTGHGGGVYVASGGAFRMNGGEIGVSFAKNHAENNGGGVYVNSDGTFIMTGGKISDNEALNSLGSGGGGVYLNSTSSGTGTTMEMTGGEISGNKASASRGGGIYGYGYGSASTLTLTIGGTAKISNNESTIGGGVYLYDGTFTMNGGEISGNTASGTSGNDGGGVYAGGSSGGVTTIGGSTKIIGNTASGTGGGIYAGKVNIGGAVEISGNKAATGGGIYGGGLITISGSVKVIGNEATSEDGGISIANMSSCTFTVGGAVVIKDNIKQGGIVSNVYLPLPFMPSNKCVITLDNPADGMSIGVQTENADGIIVNTGASEADAARFVPDEEGKIVKWYADNGGQLKLIDNPICSAGDFAQFTACLGRYPSVAAGDTLTVKVTADINITAAQTITTTTAGATLIITGDGGTITDKAGASNVRAFVLEGNAKVVLKDITIIGGNYTNPVLRVNSSATLEMEGNTILKGNLGSFVQVNGGTFNMKGGLITENVGTGQGGGVVVSSGAFNMTGGEISGNRMASGGGVYVSNGTFTVGGSAVIKGNTKTDGSADNIYLASGKTIVLSSPISGMEIEVSTASTDGIIVASGASQGDEAYFKSDDPSKIIKYENNQIKLANNPICEAGSYAEFAACIARYSNFAVTETLTIKITANIDITAAQTITTANAGSTLIITSDGAVKTLTRGTGVTGILLTITANARVVFENIIIDGANISAGSLVVVYGLLEMNSETVLRNNSKSGNGGGVLVENGGTFTMLGGEISENTVTGSGNGGGVYVNTNGTFTVGGAAVIKDNMKDGAANNVYLTSGKYITLASLKDGMSIGVTTATANGVIVESNANPSDVAYFVSDLPNYYIMNEGVTLKIIEMTYMPSLALSITPPETGEPVSSPSAVAGISYEQIAWNPTTTVFEPDCTYTVTIKIKADNDIVFADNITVKINGEDVNQISSGKKDLEISYEFPKTEALSSSSSEDLPSSSSEDISSSSSEDVSSSSSEDISSSSSEDVSSSSSEDISSSSSEDISSSSSEDISSSSSEDVSSSSSSEDISSSSSEDAPPEIVRISFADEHAPLLKPNMQLNTQNKIYYTANGEAFCGEESGSYLNITIGGTMELKVKDKLLQDGTREANGSVRYDSIPFEYGKRGGADTLFYSLGEKGKTASQDTLIIITPFDYSKMIMQKWNILIINNNPQTNGGYRFSEFNWYKKDENTGEYKKTSNTRQYYNEPGNALLNTSDSYYAELTTPEGLKISTCPGNPDSTAAPEENSAFQKRVLGVSGKQSKTGGNIYDGKGKRSTGGAPGVYIVEEK